MPHLTRALIRKRAEHNEGIISSLEEISLHQEELEGIREVLGTTCRKLKIVYLQNNIIPKMENLHHLKELEYLNLALNNIQKIEGLERCEFLNKLDLTVNFIDFDHLEESIDQLVSRQHLRELYMMGNPSQMDWDPGFKDYVIHRLPQLESLDGTHITKSMRIVAAQAYPRLEGELKQKAAECRVRKAVEAEAEAEEKAEKDAKKAARAEAIEAGEIEDVEEEEEEDEECPHTPAARVEMYKELAEEKAEKEAREKERQPKDRDFDKEQAERIEEVRRAEEDGKIRQCNEGKWTFSFDEYAKPGHVVLDVACQRHLDSSLIDVDIHPNYATVIIKSKVLRLNLPAEVRVGDSKAQRSKTTGHLVLVMPKVNPDENSVTIRREKREVAELQSAAEKAKVEAERKRKEKNTAFQMQEAGAAALGAGGGPSKAVNIRGLVLPSKGGIAPPKAAVMNAVSTTRKENTSNGSNGTDANMPPPPPKSRALVDEDEESEEEVDEDEPPPIF